MEVVDQPLTPEIRDQYEGNIVSLEEAKDKKLYIQSLGGVIGIGITSYIVEVANNMQGPLPDFMEHINNTLNTIKEDSVVIFCVDGRHGEFEQAEGSDLGVHRGSHAHGEDSDCGFADKWVNILKAYSDTQEKDKFTRAAGRIAKTAETELEKFPRGEALITSLLERGDVGLQTVQHDHAEVAAGVNEQENTTLDTEGVNEQNGRFFNLDIWKVLNKAVILGANTEDFRGVTIGLYLATEKVLVEQKKGIRLPIVVNEAA